MHKKYIVRLTDGERATCELTVSKLVGTGQKVRRAQILLKADADGPGWTDERTVRQTLKKTASRGARCSTG